MDKEQMQQLARQWKERADRLEVTAGILSGESKGRRSGEIATLRSCARQLLLLAEVEP